MRGKLKLGAAALSLSGLLLIESFALAQSTGKWVLTAKEFVDKMTDARRTFVSLTLEAENPIPALDGAGQTVQVKPTLKVSCSMTKGALLNAAHQNFHIEIETHREDIYNSPQKDIYGHPISAGPRKVDELTPSHNSPVNLRFDKEPAKEIELSTANTSVWFGYELFGGHKDVIDSLSNHSTMLARVWFTKGPAAPEPIEFDIRGFREALRPVADACRRPERPK